MQLHMTCGTEGNQVQLGIVSSLASVLLMVDLKFQPQSESNADLLPNGFAGKSASKIRWRRNGDGVQVGSIISRVAEFDLVGPCVQRHLNHGADWRAEAVTVQDEFLRGVSIDRDQKRSLTLRHVIDLHLVSARDWHIHIVEGDGAL